METVSRFCSSSLGKCNPAMRYFIPHLAAYSVFLNITPVGSLLRFIVVWATLLLKRYCNKDNDDASI
jgi:hypothetical protein